jgi:hypothetical protein
MQWRSCDQPIEAIDYPPAANQSQTRSVDDNSMSGHMCPSYKDLGYGDFMATPSMRILLTRLCYDDHRSR